MKGGLINCLFQKNNPLNNDEEYRSMMYSPNFNVNDHRDGDVSMSQFGPYYNFGILIEL